MRCKRLAWATVGVVAAAWPLAAEAADLGGPPRLAHAVPGLPPIWSGFYIGAHLGYAAGDDDAREINGPRGYVAGVQGAVGGAQFGWQRQSGSLVAGFEIEAGYLGLGSETRRDVAGGFVTSGADLGGYATIAARLGALITPSWLAYGRAGLAAAQLDASTVQTCTGADLCGGAQSTPVSSARTEDITYGFLLGAGLERRLTANWSARLEYRFMRFRDELALPAVDGPGWEHGIDVHAVKLGLNYRF